MDVPAIEVPYEQANAAWILAASITFPDTPQGESDAEFIDDLAKRWDHLDERPGAYVTMTEADLARLGNLAVSVAVDTVGKLLNSAAMAFAAMASPVSGAVVIWQERQRQLEVEGWTPEHDDEHVGGVLGMAASAYVWAAQLADAMDASDMTPEKWGAWCPDYWPWAIEAWKPSNDPLRNLAKAGALVAAEYDRVARAQVVDA